MNNVTFAMACTEVLEILKCLPENEYSKIPKSEIELLENKKDKNYNFYIDRNLPISEMNISKKANAIIIVLWEKYFSTENQSQKLMNILKQNYEKENQMKKEKYSSENIFQKKNEKNNIDSEQHENVQLIEYSEKNIFKRILNKIIKFFN